MKDATIFSDMLIDSNARRIAVDMFDALLKDVRTAAANVCVQRALYSIDKATGRPRFVNVQVAHELLAAARAICPELEPTIEAVRDRIDGYELEAPDEGPDDAGA